MTKKLCGVLLWLGLVFAIILGCKAMSTDSSTDRNAIQLDQVSKHCFKHKSYLSTKSFGLVGCNGMVVISDHEALIFDSPATLEASEELISSLEEDHLVRIIGVIPTHFHEDCLGGLEAFHAKGISSYSLARTRELAEEKEYTLPTHQFQTSKKFKVGGITVLVKHHGEGHTEDNVVAYVDEDQVLFGGCLIKSLGASKGNLADANVEQWSSTVKDIIQSYPNVTTVIPGHGASGDKELLDYTVELLKSIN